MIAVFRTNSHYRGKISILKFVFSGAAVRPEGCNGHLFTDMTPKQQCAEYNKHLNSTMGCPDPILSADFESVGYEVRINSDKIMHAFNFSSNKYTAEIRGMKRMRS